ncbi:hypothetical protein E2C01_002514 [Portunus trituberculatus]|uniref:Uncharacterized protein n=1 Tax=Portunus trituberculatus TaxID=210409 RepID=A0A5B7CJW0_PORTR|nr:hypothetical protein [Portunus trituberculatus]
MTLCQGDNILTWTRWESPTYTYHLRKHGATECYKLMTLAISQVQNPFIACGMLHCKAGPYYSLSNLKWFLGLDLNGVPGNAWLSDLEENHELSL